MDTCLAQSGCGGNAHHTNARRGLLASVFLAAGWQTFTGVTPAVAVTVRLVGIGDRRAVVDAVQHAVTIGVGGIWVARDHFWPAIYRRLGADGEPSDAAARTVTWLRRWLDEGLLAALAAP